MSARTRKSKVTMPNYKEGIASALLDIKHDPNPRKASARTGLNESAIKEYFYLNYKNLSRSWMESLTLELQKGTGEGWLVYNKHNKHYSLQNPPSKKLSASSSRISITRTKSDRNRKSKKRNLWEFSNGSGLTTSKNKKQKRSHRANGGRTTRKKGSNLSIYISPAPNHWKVCNVEDDGENEEEEDEKGRYRIKLKMERNPIKEGLIKIGPKTFNLDEMMDTLADIMRDDEIKRTKTARMRLKEELLLIRGCYQVSGTMKVRNKNGRYYDGSDSDNADPSIVGNRWKNVDEFNAADFLKNYAENIGSMDDHDDLCYKCGKCGELLCCDGCSHAFHLLCIGLSEKRSVFEQFEDEWFCEQCVKNGNGVNTFNENEVIQHGMKKKHKNHIDMENNRNKDDENGNTKNKNKDDGMRVASNSKGNNHNMTEDQDENKQEMDNGGQQSKVHEYPGDNVNNDEISAPDIDIDLIHNVEFNADDIINKYQDESNTVCYKCGVKGEGLFCCDGCQHGFHLLCAELGGGSEDKWFCDECVENRNSLHIDNEEELIQPQQEKQVQRLEENDGDIDGNGGDGDVEMANDEESVVDQENNQNIEEEAECNDGSKEEEVLLERDEQEKDDQQEKEQEEIMSIEEEQIVKTEKISVMDWNHFGVIYWLNRLNNGKFMDAKYNKFRQHIVNGKLKGSELNQLTDVTLRFTGINNENDRKEILNGIHQLMSNDDFDNMAAKKPYLDPTTVEIMDSISNKVECYKGDDIEKWLKGIKLYQYYEIFIENGFDDLESISYITKNDLEQMGVDKLGHKKKIIKNAEKIVTNS